MKYFFIISVILNIFLLDIVLFKPKEQVAIIPKVEFLDSPSNFDEEDQRFIKTVYPTIISKLDDPANFYIHDIQLNTDMMRSVYLNETRDLQEFKLIAPGSTNEGIVRCGSGNPFAIFKFDKNNNLVSYNLTR